MFAQPVTLVLAQKVLPHYKSKVSGMVNGFCWGVVALLMSILGYLAQSFGIIKVLIILSVIPIFASFVVRFIKLEE